MAQYILPKLTELVSSLLDVQSYYRLIIVVGPIGAGKTPLLKALSREEDIPYLNLNLALSERLLELSSRERPLRVRRLLEQLIDEHPGNATVLDNIELLFAPALKVNPLILFQRLSRRRIIVVAWGGAYDAERDVLTYAEPGHPEYRRYERPDGEFITLP
ncbi:MAG: BREX-3 system P-loop-containing protein BrxF [Anaerolineae bacterium]